MKETATGKVITIAATVAAVYIGIKNYKNPGFWSGVLALFLLGFSVKTYVAKKINQ